MKTPSQNSTRFHNLDSIKEWTTNDADEIYQISRWGEGYFSVNEKGDLCVNPTQTKYIYNRALTQEEITYLATH